MFPPLSLPRSVVRQKSPSLPVAAVLFAILLVAAPARADRQPFRDAGNAVVLVAKDAGALITAPTRWTQRDLIGIGTVLAVGGALLVFDDEIERFAQRNEREPGFELTRQIGTDFGELGLMGETWPYYASGMLVGYVAGVPRLMRMSAQILEAQWLSGALRNAGKLALGRRRPNEGLGPYWFEFNGGTSMPSGHAASVWSVAEVVRLHADRWWVTAPAYFVATCVSLNRLYSSAHWASDVWIGAASGIAAARFVYGRHESDGDRGARITPTVTPDGRPAVALVGTW